MGKVKVATIGDETQELKQKEKKAQKREGKKALRQAQGKARIEAVAPIVEEAKVSPVEQVKAEPKKVVKKAKAGKVTVSKTKRSAKYLSARLVVDKTKSYKLAEALEILPKIHLASFDETVELHINTTEIGVSATLTLPHGTGKQMKIAIASDEVIAEIEKGKINFDILVAEPAMMSKLAKVAKILGPKGLMPNPKNGTISQNPEEVVKKFAGGQLTLKTESKIPIIHASVGKLSFGSEKLSANIKALLGALSSEKIKNVTLKSTMSPGIKILL